MNKIPHFVLILFVFCCSCFAQENNFLNQQDVRNNSKTENSILVQIELGFKNGEVSNISKYFSAKPYLSFSNGTSAYYSANQAFYVMEEFFKEFKVISFEFAQKKIEKSLLYATGTYHYEKKGKRSSSLVYVTLNKVGRNWKITQISIN